MLLELEPTDPGAQQQATARGPELRWGPPENGRLH